MPTEGRKHCRSLPPDFLSNLPNNVIDVILMRLPCEEAVRTSILSKKWRYHWCRITELTIDTSLWETKKDKLYPTVKFTKIIYQLLTLHEGPITKFTLDIASLKSCPKIDNFIYFLSRNDIQQLVLRLPGGKLYNLPSSLFTCLQLRHLTLNNCLIHPPSAFQGFDRLISLELRNVTISSELLGSLISHCPLLEKLVLEISEVSNIIEINAPNLRSFDFIGCIGSICLTNVSLLAKACLHCDRSSSMEADYFGFAKFFESCTALEGLLLHFSFPELEPGEPDEDEVPTRLPFDVNCVKCFYLPFLILGESYELSCVLCLIRSFPYLEYLEIQVAIEEDNGIVESLELEHFSDVKFNHLREVKIERFEGTMPEMQLVKLLLAKSPVLVRILIDTWLPDEAIVTRIRPDAFTELSKYWRASPKAEVVKKS
ncbi:F-box/FBD/LRR-repeat protein At1g13570-like [Lycium barbarum]|uniref:F-box/FBD/LRR-repeat protein At1g13570-like n=1 Tax=Lycium barbarum TaxID=112863 RepID=UPI00293E3CD0|nr:F-box/FBD/LRR-repeat protein At1g13570-like [Lycium barbarum]